MDILKNLEEFEKKEFNKTAIFQFNNYNYIFPYNNINDNLVSDSSLNKYYKHYIKKQTSLINDKKAFKILQYLNNKEFLEKLRSKKEKEKSKIYQKILNKKDKQKEIEEYNNVNLKNFEEKLGKNKNNEEQGFDVMYLIMKLLKNRPKKFIKKRIIPRAISLLEEKKKYYLKKYNELLNSQEEEKFRKNVKNLNFIKNNEFLHISAKNLNDNNKNNNANSNFIILRGKKDNFNNDFPFSEKKVFNKRIINLSKNKRKNFNKENSFKIKEINYSLLNKRKNNKSNNNCNIIKNNPEYFSKSELNKENRVKSYKYFSDFRKSKDSNENKNFFQEKIYRFKLNNNSSFLDNKSLNKTSFGKFELQKSKKRNEKLLSVLNMKENEINTKSQELSKIINSTKKDEKIKCIKNKKWKNNSEEIENEDLSKEIKDEIKKLRIKNQKNNHKIEYDINSIIYANKSKYNLPVTNKFIFGHSNSESDIIDNLKKNIAYELKKQLIKKNTNNFDEIDKDEIIVQLNDKFRNNW